MFISGGLGLNIQSLEEKLIVVKCDVNLKPPFTELCFHVCILYSIGKIIKIY